MTTTYLYIQKMTDDESIEDVKKILTSLGYRSITVIQGEAKFVGDASSRDKLRVIKGKLHSQGYELGSVCQTSWVARPEGANIL